MSKVCTGPEINSLVTRHRLYQSLLSRKFTVISGISILMSNEIRASEFYLCNKLMSHDVAKM